MTRASTLMSMLLLAAAVSGCQRDKVMAPGAGQPDLLPASHYPQIVARDELDRWLVFGDPVVIRQGDAPIKVTVPVRLLDDKRGISVQYRFEFFDELKQPLGPVMDWNFKSLPSRAQVFMQGASLHSEAVDWRLVIRSAR